ncbi:hypothetical protein HZA97_05780 [Candidatus Woesearchaeota archaeon]|nr:hypothetical protein [Candidatus Woesearchaeota archaeon]
MPRPLWSFLPVGSLIYAKDQPGTVLTDSLHFAYGALGIVSCICYLAISAFTWTLNPAEQLRIRKYWSEEMQINQRTREELEKQIFGPGGFADTNFDKKVDLVERAEAYKKIGLTDFPEGGLSLKQLEELVKKYQ